MIALDPHSATLVEVDDHGQSVRTIESEELNADLTGHADVARASSEPLLANDGLSSQGFILVGTGFVLDTAEGESLLEDSEHTGVVRTGMYNIVEKLRVGEMLTEKERKVHEHAACGVLRDLHDQLDRVVAESYGWPWPIGPGEILKRLVDLHDERSELEKRGRVEWLRPDYQIPRFGQDLPDVPELALEDQDECEAEVRTRMDWPVSAIEQIAAVQRTIAQKASDVEGVASRYKGARREHVERHLETLRIMGEAMVTEDGRYALATPTPAVA